MIYKFPVIREYLLDSTKEVEVVIAALLYFDFSYFNNILFIYYTIKEIY